MRNCFDPRRRGSLACPLLEGLYLQDDESMRDLLCTPSLLRTDILKWLCLRVWHHLSDSFSFWNSYLLVLESLLQMGEQSVAKAVVQNEEFLGELLSASHLKQLGQLLCPTCTPCTDDLKELLHRDTTWGRAAHHQSLTFKLNEDHLNEMTALLHSTETLLEELNKECKFLQVDATSPPLSPSALRIAISDLSQLMSAFSQVFNTHFRGYCNRKPPVFSPSTHTFRTVHRLLNACNQELQAVEQLLDTSSDVTEMDGRA
ncbi:HAUS augmin-like complex subunit 7-like [Scleropages formosus]|uniref:HAUS augmin-like complex subunit 7-like n=1 Tax=Scleropages formosus TaxID=113540 RepID=A0A0P7UI62_SCLFO|nr:HAUS augmin-like complex subunit 7-like [Scleropages formosus]